MKFESDDEKFALMKEKLFSALLSDALDSLGRREQVMRHNIQPIDPDSIVCGRAHTWLWKDDTAVACGEFMSTFKDMNEMKPGEVRVDNTDDALDAAHSPQSFAAIGDGNARTMLNRGCAGVVTDRLARDTKSIRAMGLPLFCRGRKPSKSPSRGGVVAINVPIHCGDVLVNPGDIVFGDYDGIVVIPREIEDDVINAAVGMLEREDFFGGQLAAGKSIFQVIDEWNKLHPDKLFDEWKGLHPTRTASWH
jgi:4-hydroxy-4-methyl-2-oxoglutarate aldolase